MKQTSVGKGLIGALVFVQLLFAQNEPQFDSVTSVSLQGSFPAHADPAILFTDWDGDGLKDMLAAVYHGNGNNSLTRIQWYKNSGNAQSPEFVFQDNLTDVNGEFVSPHWY